MNCSKTAEVLVKGKKNFLLPHANQPLKKKPLLWGYVTCFDLEKSCLTAAQIQNPLVCVAHVLRTRSAARRKSGPPVAHLYAVLEDVPRDGEAFLAVDWLAEDDQLLEEEDPPLLGPGQEAAFLLGDGEGVLLQQFALSCDFALESQQETTTVVSIR